MSDTRLIAAIRHHFGKPPAYAYLPLRLPKQKEPAIGGLISSIKINCEFLAMDGWQIEGEQSSFGHDGCGKSREIHVANRLLTPSASRIRAMPQPP